MQPISPTTVLVSAHQDLELARGTRRSLQCVGRNPKPGNELAIAKDRNERIG